MTTLTSEGINLIETYLKAISGKPKAYDLVERDVSDPELKEHIRLAESAFPGYELVAHQLISDGDAVALRGAFRGTHRGDFAGIPPTGKQVSADIMLFYRLDDGKIVKHWMVLDTMGLMSKLRS